MNYEEDIMVPIPTVLARVFSSLLTLGGIIGFYFGVVTGLLALAAGTSVLTALIWLVAGIVATCTGIYLFARTF